MNRDAMRCRFIALLFCCAITFIPRLQAAEPAAHPDVALIHLPGIGGELRMDHELIGGLIAGGVAPSATILDWTGTDRGVNALGNTHRHTEAAKLIAAKITAIVHADPTKKIILTSHSGGTAIAVWALEDLPADVHINTLVMLASALSPTYDLSKALSHVTHQALSFYSSEDELVLGIGTRALGTMDRIQTEAAGYVGFQQPPQGNPKEYAKLKQIAYDPAWAKYGNTGLHIGTMAPRFAREILAPMIEGKMPIPSTQPARATPIRAASPHAGS